MKNVTKQNYENACKYDARTPVYLEFVLQNVLHIFYICIHKRRERRRRLAGYGWRHSSLFSLLHEQQDGKNHLLTIGEHKRGKPGRPDGK